MCSLAMLNVDAVRMLDAAQWPQPVMVLDDQRVLTMRV